MALFIGFGYCGLLGAQIRIDTGEIQGRVKDPSGKVIPGADVSATLAGRGIERHALTDQAGEYRFALLPPGVYSVHSSAANFMAHTMAQVQVSLGETVVLESQLQIAGGASEITVSAHPPAIDPERTQQANTIDAARVENLPINRRNYLDFALLAPGVVETSTLVDSADFRLLTTPNSGLSFGGSNGRGNSFALDGVENYSNVGGVRPSIAQVAVQEFQVNRNSYSAEYGGALGGAVNIVSKSGSNELHGDIFGYLRQSALQARNYFDPEKSAFTRVQSGASMGGALHRDKTFLFAGFERLDRHETVFVPILRDQGILSRLTASQQEIVSFLQGSGNPEMAATAGMMRGLLIPSNNPAVSALFQRNSGTFPFGAEGTQASLRLDHRWNDRHTSFLRMNLTLDNQKNSKFGALQGLSQGSTSDILDGTFMASHTWVLNSRWLSVSRASFGYDRLTFIPNDANGPQIDIAGFGTFGRNFFLPSDSRERHWQMQQSFAYVSGKHNLRFGVDVNPTVSVFRVESYFGGRAEFAEFLPLGALLNIVTGDGGFADRLGGSLAAAGKPQLAAKIGDPISSLQAFSLGLPVVYVQSFGNPYLTGWQKRYSGFVEDGYRPFRNLNINAGFRLESESNPNLHTQNNIAPRIGFAWTPAGDSTVIRGGYGLFYSRIDIQMLASAYFIGTPSVSIVVVPVSGVPGVINPQTRQPVTSIDIYQTLLAQGILGRRTVLRSDLSQFNLGPSFRFPITGGVDPNYERPYSQQASLEIEHSFGGLALSAAYNFNRAAHLPKVLDRNLVQAGLRPDGSPIFGAVNPQLVSNFVWESTANSFYHALIVQANKRFGQRVTFNAHYTFSKAIDEVTDATQDYMPNNQAAARADRGLSPFNQKHRFVANAVAQSPYHAGHGKGAVSNLLADFTFSPIFRANSGRPFNLLTGYDTLGDGQTNTHRPWGLGRDAGLGPAFFTVDARLARTIPIHDKVRLRLTVEGFNLLNKTNFQSINNIVGAVPLAQLPHSLIGRRGDPTQPFSFTSAFDPRQLQVGLGIQF